MTGEGGEFDMLFLPRTVSRLDRKPIGQVQMIMWRGFISYLYIRHPNGFYLSAI